MATYSRGLTYVAYQGWQNEFDIFQNYGRARWRYSLNGEIIYEGKKRYFHVTSATVQAGCDINSKIEEQYSYWLRYCTESACVEKYISGTRTRFMDLSNTPAGMPGSSCLFIQCVPNAAAPAIGVLTPRQTIYGFNLGNFLTNACRNAYKGEQHPVSSPSSVSCDIKLELSNNPCAIVASLRTSTGRRLDWGWLTVTTLPIYVPNTPGSQYFTGSNWETHRIKRWNGSSWVDIPGRRWSGSAWDEIQG